jgi:hypothetical protein
LGVSRHETALTSRRRRRQPGKLVSLSFFLSFLLHDRAR